MRKVVSFVLIFVMIFAFASCAAKKPTASFKISDKEGAVLYEFSAEIEDGLTAGKALENYFKENSIEYDVYDGDVLSKIGDLEQDSENWTVYWAVYVNGEYGTVSLWQQSLNDGDVIEIKFEESNW